MYSMRVETRQQGVTLSDLSWNAHLSISDSESTEGEQANAQIQNPRGSSVSASPHNAIGAVPKTTGFLEASVCHGPKAGVRGRSPKTFRAPVVVWHSGSDFGYMGQVHPAP